jgi:hypothetical protein
MIRRNVLAGLLSLALTPVLADAAAPTPDDTYRNTKATLEKAWEAEKKVHVGVIRAHEKHLQNLATRYSRIDPKFANLRQGLARQIRKVKADLAKARGNYTRRETEVRGKIEAAASNLSRAHADAVHKAEAVKAEFQAKFDAFRRQIEGTVEQWREWNRRVTGRYRVAYDLNRIETNLGGRRQTVTLAQFRRLHLGGNPRAPLVPRKLCDDIEAAPRNATVEAKGFGIVVTVTKDGRTAKGPGLIDYRRGKFLAGGSGGYVITPIGTILHTLTIDGDLRLTGRTRFRGRVVTALTGWTHQGGGGIYVSVPFEAVRQ